MKKSEFIWLDGELVEWDKATVSVMTHTLHYGTGVLKGCEQERPHKVLQYNF
jgi:branched-chain amino acid aminotransferase